MSEPWPDCTEREAQLAVKLVRAKAALADLRERIKAERDRYGVVTPGRSHSPTALMIVHVLDALLNETEPSDGA